MYDEILTAVNFSDVATAVLAIAAILITVFTVLYGAALLLNFIRGDPDEFDHPDEFEDMSDAEYDRWKEENG